MSVQRAERGFFGWRVVQGAFVLAMFGWGIGFYGPPVFLHAVVERTGWPVSLVSAAVTAHYLVGALVTANLLALYGRHGIPTMTKAAAVSLGLGACGWAWASETWQLFAAAALSGAGWVGLSAAAINAILAPWFERRRPAALAMAYNGASIGGAVFSPLWVTAIALLGFPATAGLIGIAMVAIVWVMADRLFAKTPSEMGLAADGDGGAAAGQADTQVAAATPLPGSQLWRSRRFVTLSAGMALSLFAQIGLVTHLYSLLVPALGPQAAGIAMGCATGAAILGRTLVGWYLGPRADRRLAAVANCALQVVASLILALAAGENVALLWAGALLFGIGIGNATSLPPLIAQTDFARGDVARAVALIVAVSQASYAFSPAAFGIIRDVTAGAAAHGADVPLVFLTAAALQGLSALCFAAGRR